MALLGEYREAVEEGLASLGDVNLVKKIGFAALIVMSERQARADERYFEVAPRVDSPERAWNPWTNEELEQELKELVDESEPNS